jgi:hypothetical protein
MLTTDDDDERSIELEGCRSGTLRFFPVKVHQSRVVLTSGSASK